MLIIKWCTQNHNSVDAITGVFTRYCMRNNTIISAQTIKWQSKSCKSRRAKMLSKLLVHRNLYTIRTKKSLRCHRNLAPCIPHNTKHCISCSYSRQYLFCKQGNTRIHWRSLCFCLLQTFFCVSLPSYQN